MALSRSAKEKIILAVITLAGSLGTAWITARSTAQSAVDDAAAPAVESAAATAVANATRVPLGTIIASMLSPSEMARTEGDAWLPADGRSVGTSSPYAVLSGRTELPDLRGMFARGLNQFDGARPMRDAAYLDPDNARAPGSAQRDAVSSHSHQVGLGTSDVGAVPSSGAVVLVAGRRMPSYINDQYSVAPAPLSGATGDQETRPKNVAVYYYIRVK